MEKQTQEENKSLPIDAEPYGEEWIKEISKLPKKFLIEELLRPALIKNSEVERQYRNLPNNGWQPLTKEEKDFMIECGMSPTYYDGKLSAVTIMTEDSEGAFLEPDDLLKLSDILKRYVKTATT